MCNTTLYCSFDPLATGVGYNFRNQKKVLLSLETSENLVNPCNIQAFIFNFSVGEEQLPKNNKPKS